MEPARKKKAAGAGDKAKRTVKTIPADTTIRGLARAIWGETVLKAKGKVERSQRGELWKKDAKEYTQIARRVVSRLSRRAGAKGKPRTKKASAEAKPSQ